MQLAKNLLESIASQQNLLQTFSLYRESEAFSIYRLPSDERVELAIIRSMPKPHTHDAAALFFPLDPMRLLLGGRDHTGSAQGQIFELAPHTLQIIAPQVIHAAWPTKGSPEVRLLIFSETNGRSRGDDAYTDDTKEVPLDTIRLTE